MSLITKFKSKTSWQLLVIFKLALLTAIWVTLDDGFHFGDKQVQAEEKKAETKAEETPPADKPEEKARESFLSNLLNLPKLNPDNLKKAEIGRYMELAERKKRQVDDRLAMLSKREQHLVKLEDSIDDKLVRLDEERRYFTQTIQREKDLKGKRLDKLITLYAKMEPKKASPILEKLDKDLVVSLFKALPQKQITKFLEAMSPEKSVELSEYYGRVSSGREYDLLKEMNTSLLKEFEECKGLPKK